MNITDQIVECAELNCEHHTREIENQASFLSSKDRHDFYKAEYSRISKFVAENFKDQARDLPLGDMLSFNRRGSLFRTIRNYFWPLSHSKPIIFQKTPSKNVVMGPYSQPHVCDNYNFAWDDETGRKLAEYLGHVYTLLWLRSHIGFDSNQYPETAGLIIFENDDMTYIRYVDMLNRMKLYYGETDSEDMQACLSLKRYIRFGILNPLVEKLPYYEGQEAQDCFDFEWYKARKQSPLNYRCFPNYGILRKELYAKSCDCNWTGEYCIERDELEDRFLRFTKVLEKLPPDEQEEIIVNTIDYFDCFLTTDCFEKTIHKKPFEEILSKLKRLQVDSLIPPETEFFSLSGRQMNDAGPICIPAKQVSTINFLIGSQKEKEELLSFMVETYFGKKGKRIAIMIQALEKNTQIAYHERTELYAALRKDFGDIGADSGINKYMTDLMREDKAIRKEVELHAEKIRKHLENLPK